jgi:L-glyceraldehyde 3-phosphate reductase
MSAMIYNRCGRSGLLLPAISLGLWHNFGGDAPHENKRAMCWKAFDLGITHFDLANNYGPPPGSAEEAFGQIMREDFRTRRDEIVISTKAGYRMWDGPYGEWGGRKSLIASLDQSLKRMGIAYVDIFYSHRFDPDTPLEETMGALDFAVRSGRTLYVGISSYAAEATRQAAKILRGLGTPAIIHQPRYSMLDRTIETAGILDAIGEEGMGCIPFSPLAQGLLTGKYLGPIQPGSRAAQGKSLDPATITPQLQASLRALDVLAKARGQSLTQLALAWALRDTRVTSALIGASRPEQIVEAVGALDRLGFAGEELAEIERSLKTLQ